MGVRRGQFSIVLGRVLGCALDVVPPEEAVMTVTPTRERRGVAVAPQARKKRLKSDDGCVSFSTAKCLEERGRLFSEMNPVGARFSKYSTKRLHYFFAKQ